MPQSYSHPVMPQPVANPRVAYESWLAINFVPPEYHEELTKRLDLIQQQAVHIAALRLRETGHTAAAELIDPLEGE